MAASSHTVVEAVEAKAMAVVVVSEVATAVVEAR